MVRMLLLASLLLGPTTAFAQSTQKSIRIVVPFAPGASADGIARAISNGFGKTGGRTVVVGATGALLI